MCMGGYLPQKCQFVTMQKSKTFMFSDPVSCQLQISTPLLRSVRITVITELEIVVHSEENF